MPTGMEAHLSSAVQPSPAAAALSPKTIRRVLTIAALIAALGLSAQVGVALYAQYSLTQVESIIGIHARTLAEGGGLYYDLNAYPYTVSPYGPVYYAASAALQALGLEPLAAGRLVSLAALLGLFWIVDRLLRQWNIGGPERAVGLILLVSSGVAGSWGVVGQSDVLALLFSVAALERFEASRRTGRSGPLIACGLLIALAIFTKQTFVAAGASVVGSLWLTRRRRAAKFTTALAVCGVATAAALQVLTEGRFLANAVLANLNPFAWWKLADHLKYFGLVNGWLALVALSGFARRARFHPLLHLYLAASTAVWLLTAPKIGSDLNYQLEPVTALCLAAAWSLDRLRFFPLLSRRDPGWVTLLQIPLLLHLTLNVVVDIRGGLTRWVREQLAQQQTAQLAPWLEPGAGRVLSVEIDALMQAGRRMEVEPLIYSLLVEAGVTDPAPVERDLAEGAFSAVLLYFDVDGGGAAPPEAPSLPPRQLELIRRHYHLAAHVPGPLLGGVYVYEPNATR